MGETGQQLQNGKDYILKFEGKYDTPEYREKYTKFVEDALERMPELAQKLIEARELNGSVPIIDFSDRFFIGGKQALAVHFHDSNLILLNPEALKDLGIYDVDRGCAVLEPLVFSLGHELAHLADPELKGVIDWFSQDIEKSSEDRAVAFEDLLKRKYGIEAGIPERVNYLNGYLRKEFSWGALWDELSNGIEETIELITGNAASRSDLHGAYSIDEDKYPKNVGFCPEEKQPDPVWLPKA
jgi:hypothetical protein